jgi:hypothetical protein
LPISRFVENSSITQPLEPFEKDNNMEPSSPLSPIKFGRGGLAKKRFRRSALHKTTQDGENHPNAGSMGTNHSSKIPISSTTVEGTTPPTTAKESSIESPSVDDWWIEKRDHFHHWLRCNPLRLGIGADSVDFIKEQLKRGDKQPDRRSTCWRHCVVELISTGVPGLDIELLSVAEIPKAKYDNIDMRALLNTTDSNMKGTLCTVQSITDMPLDVLRNEIVRLGKERKAFIDNLKNMEVTLNAALQQEKDATDACTNAQNALKASVELQNKQMEQIEKLTIQIKSLKKQIADGLSTSSNIAGSGIAAVKALTTAEERPSSANTTVTPVDINSMSMLERQQHFSALRTKKRDDALARKKKEEEDEIQKLIDERKAASKKRSNQWEHVRSRLHDVVATGTRKKSEVGSSTSIKNDTSNTNGTTKKSTGWGKIRNLKAEGKLKIKKKVKKINKKDNKNPCGTGGSSLLDICQQMLKKKPAATPVENSAEPPPTPTANHATTPSFGFQPPATVTAVSESTVTPEPTNKEPVVEPAVTEPVVTKPAVTKPAVTEPAEEEPVKKETSDGFFDKFGTNDLKGKHVIQDSMPFNIDTFFRKRDKHAGCDGVSLLMARKDDNHGTQEAIAVFFDRSKFTEEEAFQWWLSNRVRFPYYEK